MTAALMHVLLKHYHQDNVLCYYFHELNKRNLISNNNKSVSGEGISPSHNFNLRRFNWFVRFELGVS